MIKNSIFCLLVLIGCLLLTPRASDRKNPSLLWQDQFDLAGHWDLATSIAVSGQRALAIGVGSETGTTNLPVDLLVRAYDLASGTLQWQDQMPLISGVIDLVFIDDLGQTVFVTGYVPGGLLIRAYDARTGDRLWEDIVDKGRARAIAASHAAVFVVGGVNIGESENFLVRAYDPRTGALLWGDQADIEGNSDIAWAVATEGGMAFVLGSTSSDSTTRDVLLRAYDGTSGQLAWQIRRAGASASAIAANGKQVFIGGDPRISWCGLTRRLTRLRTD